MSICFLTFDSLFLLLLISPVLPFPVVSHLLIQNLQRVRIVGFGEREKPAGLPTLPFYLEAYSFAWKIPSHLSKSSPNGLFSRTSSPARLWRVLLYLFPCSYISPSKETVRPERLEHTASKRVSLEQGRVPIPLSRSCCGGLGPPGRARRQGRLSLLSLFHSALRSHGL